MTDVSVPVELAKAVGALVAVVVFFVLFLMGPMGWILAIALVGGLLIVRGALAGDSEGPTGVNCPNCGSRLDADTNECDYCGAAQ